MLDIHALLRFRSLPLDQRLPYQEMATTDETQDRLSGGHPWTVERRELIAARYWTIQAGDHP